MENITFSHKYLFDARFKKVEPRKADEVRDNYAKVSLHTHSKQGAGWPNKPEQLRDLIVYCSKNGVKILALTDHEKPYINRNNAEVTDQRFEQILDIYGADVNDSSLRIRRLDVTVLRSKEFWSDNGTHVLGIGYEGEIENNHELSVDYLVKRIKDHNGIVDIPHPFFKFKHGIIRKDLETLLKSPDTKPDMIEGVNSANVSLLRYFNKKAIKFGIEHNIPLVTGSDAHFPFQISYGHILIPEVNTKNDLLEVIENGKHYNYARPVPLKSTVFAWPVFNKLAESKAKKKV